MIPSPPPNYEQAMEALVACGVPAANIRIAYEDELQSDVIMISDLGGSEENRLRCVKEAVHPFYILHVDNDAQRRAFYSLGDREDRRLTKAEAVKWLDAAGMLDCVPRYDPSEGIESFAQSLEAACELSPGSSLETFGESILTFRREFLETNLAESTFDKSTCLSWMIAASSAYEHDIRLGLIGNEALNEDEQ